MSQSLRTFLAIELNDEFRKSAREAQNILKPSGAPVRWVRPENLHLTLKFLGDTPPETIDQLKKKIPKLLENVSAFDLRLTELGAFPSFARPRVIWLGCEESTGALKNMVKLLEKKLQNLGFKREKRSFHPHITLGRIKHAKNAGKLQSLADTWKSEPLVLKADGVTLFQSTLTDEGSVYTVLEKFPLRTETGPPAES